MCSSSNNKVGVDEQQPSQQPSNKQATSTEKPSDQKKEEVPAQQKKQDTPVKKHREVVQVQKNILVHKNSVQAPQEQPKGNSTCLLEVTDKDGDPVDISQFSMVGLYFSSKSCPDCQQYTTALTQAYNLWISKSESIEIIFISNDGSEQDANENYKNMNFSRLVYNEKIIKELNSRLKVDKVPHFEIRTSDLKQTITRKALSHMSKKKASAIMDWKKLLSSLGSGENIPDFFSDDWAAYYEGQLALADQPCDKSVLGENNGITYQYKPVNLQKRASDVGGADIKIYFNNAIKGQTIKVDWVDCDGKCEEKLTMKSNDVKIKPSFTGHIWVLRKENGTPFATYNAPNSIEADSTVYVIIKNYDDITIEIDLPK